MDIPGSQSLTAVAEARIPRWNVWFIGAVLLVSSVIFIGLASRIWTHAPRTSDHLLAAAIFAVPFLLAGYLDRTCPRSFRATATGLHWTTFVFGREHHAPWDAIASARLTFTKTNDSRGDCLLKLRGRFGRLVLPGQMIDRDVVLEVLRANRPDLVSPSL